MVRPKLQTQSTSEKSTDYEPQYLSNLGRIELIRYVLDENDSHITSIDTMYILDNTPMITPVPEKTRPKYEKV